MGLRDELDSMPSRNKVDRAIEFLGDEGPEFRELLEDPNYSAESLARLLKRRGFEISVWPIKKWKKEHGVSFRRS